MPRAARQLATPLTLEQRLAENLRMTAGQMPLVVIVTDEAERERARQFLAGKRGAKCLTVETAAESAARWAKRGWV